MLQKVFASFCRPHAQAILNLGECNDVKMDRLLARQWWHTPLIPTFGRQRQVDLCEFETSLIFKS